MEYGVQILVVREVTVEADDDLQAEREAYRALNDKDKGAAIALCVLERIEDAGGGALDSDDPADCWQFAKKHFDSLNRGWVTDQ